MRVLVTGPANPVGAAIVRELAAAGHSVRAFGVPAGENPFANLAGVEPFPGDVAIGGSIEPVAVECQAVVHAASLDAIGDRLARTVHVERGTLYTRYGAERELVERFICILPQSPERGSEEAVASAEAHAKATRSLVPVSILRASAADPEGTAREVVRILGPAKPAPTVAVASGH